MESSKESIKNVFDSFDKDGDGYIERSEIKAISTELGKQVSEAELNKIFKEIDINGDGKISFNEFYTWWHYGKENKLEELVYFKFKTLKLLSKTEKKLAKVGALLENKYESEFSEHFFSVQVGDAPPKTSLGLRLLFGQSQVQHTQEVLKGLEISDKVPSLVIKMKSTDAEKLKESLKDIFEQILAIAEGLLPEEITQNFLPAVKISYAIPEPNYVSVGISFDHEIIEQVVGIYMKMFEQFLSEEFGSSIHLSASIGTTAKEIAQNTDKKFTDFFGQGLNISLDVKINQGIISKVRSLLFGSILESLEKNVVTKQSKKLKSLVPLFLLSGSKIALHFKSIEDLTNQLQIPGVSSLKEVSSMVKESFHPQAMAGQLPVIQELIDAFKNLCESDFSLTVQMPKVAVNLYESGEGLSDLFNLFYEENP